MLSLDGEQVKKWLYIVSTGLIALSCILGLATLTQKGESDGRLSWIFGLTFVSIPFLIYNGLTPHYPRAQRFSHPYAHSTVDILLSLLWLSAWSLSASYVSSGKGCSNFTHGSATKCRLATANTIFAVAIMFCFLGTAYLSLRAVMAHKRDGEGARAYKRDGRTGIAFPARQASFGRSDKDGGKERLRSTDRRVDNTDIEEQEEVFDPRVGRLDPYEQVRTSDKAGEIDARPQIHSRPQLQIYTSPQDMEPLQAGGVYEDHANSYDRRRYEERQTEHDLGYHHGTDWPVSVHSPLDREGQRR